MQKHLKTLLPTVVAILTVTGIVLHDTKIDSLTKFALAIPVAIVAYEGSRSLMLLGLGGDAHTHVERASIDQRANRSTSLMPKLGSRKNEDKKYRMNKSVQQGYHAFDSYNLPLVA